MVVWERRVHKLDSRETRCRIWSRKLSPAWVLETCSRGSRCNFIMKWNKKVREEATYPDVCVGKTGLCKRLWETEITQLDHIRFVQKDYITPIRWAKKWEGIGLTIIWLQISMQYLRSFFSSTRSTTATPGPPMTTRASIRMMTMLQC